MARVPRNSRLLGILPFLALVLHQVQFMFGKGKNVPMLFPPSTETRYLVDSIESGRSTTHHRSSISSSTNHNRFPSDAKYPPISATKSNWWDDYVNSLAVTYKKWNGPKYSWCLKDEKQSHDINGTGSAAESNNVINGMLFVKTFKTGSSTAASLTLRISQKVGERHLASTNETSLISTTISHDSPKPASSSTTTSTCKTSFRHEFMLQNLQSYRKQPSLLWTIVRDPAKRVQSAFNYFHIGLKGMESSSVTMSDEQMMSHFDQKKNVQVSQLRVLSSQPQQQEQRDSSLSPPSQSHSRSSFDSRMFQSSPRILIARLKKQIFSAYDFVAVLERWEESVAVMQLLFDLEDEDMIVFATKSSGSWTWNLKNTDNDDQLLEQQPQQQQQQQNQTPNYYKTKEAGCFFIPEIKSPSFKVQKYLSTNFTHENADYLLHAAANRSLDLTINALGRDRVVSQVKKLRQLQTLVENYCLHSTYFPCSSNGTLQSRKSDADCYWRDMGCGHKCIDRILSQNKLGLLPLSS